MLLVAVAATALTIAVSPGNGGATRHWTLQCGPVAGTLPHAANAQVARVSGTFGGHKVRATFNRRGGCEIARWNRVSFLFR